MNNNQIEFVQDHQKEVVGLIKEMIQMNNVIGTLSNMAFDNIIGIAMSYSFLAGLVFKIDFNINPILEDEVGEICCDIASLSSKTPEEKALAIYSELLYIKNKQDQKRISA